MTVQVATDTGAVVHYQSNHSFVAANFTQVSSGQRLICYHSLQKNCCQRSSEIFAAYYAPAAIGQRH